MAKVRNIPKMLCNRYTFIHRFTKLTNYLIVHFCLCTAKKKKKMIVNIVNKTSAQWLRVCLCLDLWSRNLKKMKEPKVIHYHQVMLAHMWIESRMPTQRSIHRKLLYMRFRILLNKFCYFFFSFSVVHLHFDVENITGK